MAHAEISVNLDIIDSNKKNNANNAPLSVKRGDQATFAHSVEILDSGNNMVASVSYMKGDEPEVKIIAPTGIRINTDPIMPSQPDAQAERAASGFHLEVNDIKE